MWKPKASAALLSVVIILMTVSIYFYLNDKRTSPNLNRTTRPDMGLGYHPPYTPGSGIKNSPHDLSAKSGYNLSNHYNPEGETSICIFCHIPDESRSPSGMADSPKWNHASSAVVSFTPYSNGSIKPNNQSHRLSADVSRGPGPVSKFCLSCHDGATAVNHYGSLSGNVYISDSYKVGKNGVLSNHHPIGFVYAADIDDEINPAATLGGHSVEELLSNGRMECTTCHDVHNKGNSGEKLLWVSDKNSNLCCSCHLKCSTK